MDITNKVCSVNPIKCRFKKNSVSSIVSEHKNGVSKTTNETRSQQHRDIYVTRPKKGPQKHIQTQGPQVKKKRQRVQPATKTTHHGPPGNRKARPARQRKHTTRRGREMYGGEQSRTNLATIRSYGGKLRCELTISDLDV